MFNPGIMVYIYRIILKSSGISDLCGTEAGMVTPKGSMSTERERHSKFLSYLTGARYVHPW
jgi:hypothetical protein